jgi:hypothetical protein
MMFNGMLQFRHNATVVAAANGLKPPDAPTAAFAAMSEACACLHASWTHEKNSAGSKNQPVTASKSR